MSTELELKKLYSCVALISFASTMPLYALGLGEMEIKSALNQPFWAEIKLLDSNGVQLNNLKAVLADPANYDYLGLHQAADLSLLSFKVEKNKDGRAVVVIRSVEQITEPYMDLVVDLAWRGGQLYKAYNVLLDPPGYQLKSSRVQGSATYYKKAQHNETTVSQPTKASIASLTSAFKTHEKEKTYGPTLANESVWQLAQRYKTSAVKLSQVVLAIVGANPDSFDKGNLNNLKVGVQLKIPTSAQMQRVPADKAEQEVNAHDVAWNKKIDIQHVLAPPYYVNDSAEPSRLPAPNSMIPTLPQFAKTAQGSEGAIPQLILKDFIAPINSAQHQTKDNNASIKAEFSITTSAIESLQESNALLRDQFNALQEQNKKLQVQLDKRNKDIELIREQIQLLMKQREAVAGQANKQNDNTSSSLWSWIVSLLLAAGGGGSAYWYFNNYQKKKEEEQEESAIPEEDEVPVEPVIPQAEVEVEPEPKPEPIKPVLVPDPQEEVEQVTENEADKAVENQFDPIAEYEIPIDESSDDETHLENTLKEAHLEEDHVLEFEHGLHEVLKDKPEETIQEIKHVEEEDELDFKASPIESVESTSATEVMSQDDNANDALSDEPSDPLKSKQAFDTLLDLAQTYISMDDVESAIHALEEVQEHGTQLQKEKAQGLLLQIRDRKN